MARIILSANTSWYLYNFRRNTILALQKAGHEVLAVSPSDPYKKKLEDIGCRHVPLIMDQGSTNPFKEIVTLWDYFKIYRRERPGLVLNFTPKSNIYSTLAAAFWRIPSINNVSGLGWAFARGGFMSYLAKFWYRVSSPLAAKIFFQNEEDRALFLKYKLAAKDKTARIPGSGVDLERFKPTPAPDDNIVRFLLSARMLRHKGIEEYAGAAKILKKKYPNTEFQLLGFLDDANPRSITKAEMDSWAADGIVNYLGTTSHVEEYIAQADCVVLPSYYREGVPKSLLEGGAMAKPIITTDNVGCRDTVEDGVNGYLCAARDAGDLAAKMEKIIIMSHQDRLAMGEKSRTKIACDFDEKIIIEAYMNAVSEILKI